MIGTAQAEVLFHVEKLITALINISCVCLYNSFLVYYASFYVKNK